VSVDLHARSAVRVDWQGGPAETPVAIAPTNALEQQVRAFAAAIRGEPCAPLATAAEGLRALELAWQVRGAIEAAQQAQQP
jgi:predicted dehydrogenase